MELDRAKEINSALLDIGFFTEGLKTGEETQKAVDLLGDVSLSDMLKAGEVVRQENERTFAESVENMRLKGSSSRTIMMVCDDRLVAAIYAALNYSVGHETIVVLPDRRQIVIQRYDEDEREAA
jgi:hypothetical protein